MEGNYAPHMGATITHGNAGYLTYFRNYSSSQFAPPAVAGSTAKQTGNITAIQFDTGDLNMTVIGNVLGSSAATDLGTAPRRTTYLADGSESGAIFDFGDKGKADVSYTSLWCARQLRHREPERAVERLPSPRAPCPRRCTSPAQTGVVAGGQRLAVGGPDLSPMVGTLPAKARSDQMVP